MNCFNVVRVSEQETKRKNMNDSHYIWPFLELRRCGNFHVEFISYHFLVITFKLLNQSAVDRRAFCTFRVGGFICSIRVELSL